MLNGADGEDLGVLAQAHHRALEPLDELVARLRIVYGLFILQIVENNQVGAVLPVAQAAHALAGATRDNRDPGVRPAIVDIPLLVADQVAEILAQLGVGFQLLFDGCELECGVRLVVTDEDDEPAQLVADAIKREDHRNDGGLRMLARRGDGRILLGEQNGV